MNSIVKNRENKMEMGSNPTSINQEKLEVLKRHFGKGLTFEELELFGLICERTQLDPFVKQIYPVKRKTKQDDGSYRDIMVIQVAIDGLRSIAERSGCYSPGKEPTYVYDDQKEIISATAYIKKMTPDGTWHDVSATAFMREYRPKYGKFWDNMPHLMLAKCAEALAIRKAFPSQTCRVYTPEEMHQAGSDATFTDNNEVSEPNNKQAQVIECDNMQPIDELKRHLSLEGISSNRLQEWINMRAQMKNQTADNIIKACLEKDILPKFKMSFAKFLEQEEPESLAI